MDMRNRWVVLLLLPLCCVVQTAGAEPEKREGGTLQVAVPNKIQSLDPTQAEDEPSKLLVWNLFDQLYEYHYLKRPYELVPCLAAALPAVSDDQLTYTIRLKKGVRYVDDACFPGGKGRTLNASDVVFCFKRLMDARVKSPGTWVLKGRIAGLDAFAESSKTWKPKPDETTYPDVEGIVAVDAHTVRIKLVRPYAQIRWLLASQYLSIYPPEAVAAYGDKLGEHAVSTGPYVVSAYEPATSVLLKRNPNYREDRYPSEGKAGDDEAGFLADESRLLPLHSMVVVKVFAGKPLSEWLYFREGQIDVTMLPAGEAFDAAIDRSTMDLVPDLKKVGMRLNKEPRLEIWYDAFNMEDPILGHPNGEKGKAIRRAISLVTDDDWTMNTLYRGQMIPQHGPILREFQEYDEYFMNDAKRQPGDTRQRMIREARKELERAGYPDGKGLPVFKKDVTEYGQSIFERFQKDAAQIGIKFEGNPIKWGDYKTRLANKEAQMWSISWTADYPDAQNFLQLFYGPNSPDPNASNYDNPAFNELYEKAMQLPPGEERTDLYREMAEIVAEDCPWIFRYRRVRYGVTQHWLQNYRFNAMGERFFKYCRVDTAARIRGLVPIDDK